MARIRTPTRFLLFLLIVLPVLAFLANHVHAVINPNFTPIHLVEQSGLIVVVQFEQRVTGSAAQATIKKVLKGKTGRKSLTIGFADAANEAQAKAIRRRINGTREQTALLFVGEYIEEEDEAALDGGEEEGGEAKAMLHVAGEWVVLFSDENNVWHIDHIDQHLQGTWAGGTEMLNRAVRYILSDPDADVPVESGVDWDVHFKVGRMPGTVTSMRGVDLGTGAPLLHVASDQGDRLFRYDAKSERLRDVTKAFNLTARSVCSAWGDFNGRGRLGLASWDGETLGLHERASNGTFCAPRRVGVGDAFRQGCVSLSTVDGSGLLVGTRGVPVLLTPDGKGGFSVLSLPEGTQPKQKMGAAGACLVADLDGDARPDVLQIFASGGYFYKRESAKRFEPPVSTRIALGNGPTDACLGDYDADGRLDVFTVAEDRCRLWHNLGKGQFVEMLGLSGEVAYISKPGGVAAMTGDINNDGRQDIFIAYAARAPHIFFNRGFRSFGHARRIDLAHRSLLAAAEEGQQAGCLADLDGDGAQDMAIALKGGDVWVFLRAVEEDGNLGVRPVLAGGAARHCPITVTGWVEERCLGAWNVVPGGTNALIGTSEAGPLVLKWRLPGGKEQSREVIVEDETVRFKIE